MIQKTCSLIREGDDNDPWRRVARGVSDNMIVDHVDDIIFCPALHHRSTAWSSALHALVRLLFKHTDNNKRSEKTQREDRIIDKRLPDEGLVFKNRREFRHFLDGNAKILLVSHPFERLLAVFQDRFQDLMENRRSQYWNRMSRKIIRLHHPAYTEEEIRDAVVSFEEFIQFIVYHKDFNVHWGNTYEVCHPCDIQYDYIGKVETLQTDIKYMMKKLYGSTDMAPVVGGHLTNKRNDIARMKSYYRNATLNSLLFLYDQYSVDFYMYNYTWPFETLTL